MIFVDTSWCILINDIVFVINITSNKKTITIISTHTKCPTHTQSLTYSPTYT